MHLLLFARLASAAEHPFLLVTEDMYPTMHVRAANSPWKEWKAVAIADVNKL